MYIMFQVVPWGLRETLRFIKDKYNNPPVYITENGYCGEPENLNDVNRINYHHVSFFLFLTLKGENILIFFH